MEYVLIYIAGDGRKAYDFKGYIAVLFDRFKLKSFEFVMEIQ